MTKKMIERGFTIPEKEKMASIESTRRGLKNPEKRALLIIHFRRDKKRHGKRRQRKVFTSRCIGTLR